MTTSGAQGEIKRYVCARCGCNVGYWYYGWKHQTGGHHAKPTCGLKPAPVKAPAKEPANKP